MCVHCGVGRPGALRIERRARNVEYTRLDNSDATPPTKRVKNDGADILRTLVKLPELVERLHRRLPDVDVEVSEEAGLFLCEFS